MAKKELRKEAEEHSFRYTLDKPWACEVERKQIMAYFVKGYLAGAEPREKRIAELEATNKKISDECHKLVDSLEKKQNENKELHERCKNCALEISKGKLEDLQKENDNLIKRIQELEKENAELKKTVEHYRKEREFFIGEVEINEM